MMDDEKVPRLFWIVYESIYPKTSINEKTVTRDIVKFKKDVNRGLSGAIAKKDGELVKFQLWRMKKNNRKIASIPTYVNAVKTGDLEFIKFIFNNVDYDNRYRTYSDVIEKTASFITPEIFQLFCNHFNISFYYIRAYIYTATAHDNIDLFEYLVKQHNKEGNTAGWIFISEADLYLNLFHVACRNGNIRIAKHIYNNYLKECPREDLDYIIERVNYFIENRRSWKFMDIKKFLKEISNNNIY